VGKTQLAVEVGHRLRRSRPEQPIVLCELATADTDSAVDVVAAALGIDPRPGTPLAARVAAVIGDADVTVVVDNCEHVLEPVAELVDGLLRACPNMTVLATSRERLRVPGEQVVVVPPLAVDGDDSPAVALFVARARAVRPGFSPDADERAVIAEIARRLDGLPLAIELGAACLHTLDLVEVASWLDHRFALLSSGSRVSPRHASLGAAVWWSYGLLDASLQRMYRAVSVFVGPFTAADAAAVFAVDSVSATVALAQLTERSLVQRTPDRRYVLLETLRAFGIEQLAATGEADLVGERHARHMVDWVVRADGRLSQPGEPAIAEIDAAIPELRAALAWLLDHGEHELAGRLIGALIYYGLLRLRPDVLAWSATVAAADPDDRSPAAPEVWAAAAYGAWLIGDIDGAHRHSERVVRAADRIGGLPPSKAVAICGTVALISGRLDDAIRWYRRAVEAAGADTNQRLFSAASELLPLGYAGDPTAAERAERLLAEVSDIETAQVAYVWYCAGETVLAADVDLARARLSRAIELAERFDVAFVSGVAGASKASLDARLGDPAVAAADYRWLLDLWRRAGIWSTQWTMLRSIAGLLHRLGQPRDAAVLVGAVQAARAGHRVFGADEVALAQLGKRLRVGLGDDVYRAALAEGGALDGDAAVEHARRAL
jgi:predicted ATPase